MRALEQERTWQAESGWARCAAPQAGRPGWRMQATESVYRFDRAELNPASRELRLDGEPAPLGARAFDVLLALVTHRERMLTKNELLDLVWPGLVVEENNLQVQVSALR